MDRKLLDYLPPVLREVMEMRAINEANEPEISMAWDALALVLANQFLETADTRGVAVWEKELKIFPKDTDTLELRKARVKAMWNMETPYTVPWLKSWLTNICGPEGHEETIRDYTIDLRLDYTRLPEPGSLAAEIFKILLAIRPSNMLIVPTAVLKPFKSWAIAGGAFTGSRREVHAIITPPPLIRPRGEALPTTYGALGGLYRQVAVTVRMGVPVPPPTGRGGTECSSGAFHTYQRIGVFVRGPVIGI